MKVTKISPKVRSSVQPNRVRVYVDGSSDNHKTLTGGWAAVILVPNERHRIISGFIPPPTNNQVAELMAAVEGLELAWELALDQLDSGCFAGCEPQVEVISDSAYVVKGVTQYEAVWRLNGWVTSNGTKVKHRELWDRLLRVDCCETVWTHIRGHKGNVFNEMVDAEAGVARKLGIQNLSG